MKSMRFLALLTAACILQPAQAHSAQPEYVHLIRRGIHMPQQWYEEQARLWKTEVERNPDDAAAWRNYYMATAYSLWGTTDSPEGERRVSEIFDEMGSAVPDSYEYLYLKARSYAAHLETEELNDLFERGLELCPQSQECTDLYEELAVQHEQNGNLDQARVAWAQAYRTGGLASGLIDYNYNMLMSTDADAILFTNGDNDTFPAWMLQRLKGIREDVLVLNVFLSRKERSYLARELRSKNVELDTEALPAGDADFLDALCEGISRSNPDVSIYVALTVANRYKAKIEDKLYVTGLASLYSESRVDNIALLKRNVGRRFRLDYLRHDWYSEDHISTVPEVYRLNGNYSVPFIMLFEHFMTGEELERAEYWRGLTLEIARKSSDPSFLEAVEKRVAR